DARRRSRHRGRGARHPGHGRGERDGHRADRRGVRGRRHRRARLHAWRAGRRADRRHHARRGRGRLSRSRDARDLRRRDRRARAAAGGVVRAGRRVIGRVAVAGALAALALFPLAGRAYYATLMLPFFGYGVALLGLNLLFGTTGLLSFGHALFVALGASAAAVFTSKLSWL